MFEDSGIEQKVVLAKSSNGSDRGRIIIGQGVDIIHAFEAYCKRKYGKRFKQVLVDPFNNSFIAVDQANNMLMASRPTAKIDTPSVYFVFPIHAFGRDLL
jgi:hypothetical protein